MRGNSRRGVALVLTTLLLFVIGPVVGLAIDVGIVYLLKLRLSQAADAACLAGARSLSRGADIASQRASAIAVAERYFDVNFPAGYWASSNRTRSITVNESASRMRMVTLDADVDVPLYFLRFVNKEWAHLHITAEARRRDVNVIMVLDRSGSMQNAGACDDLRDASRQFVDKFANGRDRIGMLTFNGGYKLDYTPTMYFKDSPSIYPKIDAIQCQGWTGTHQSLWLGYQQLRNINEQGALNVILFFTDGRPTALTARYPIKTLTDQRYGDGNSPYSSLSSTYNYNKSLCRDEFGRDYTSAAWNPQPKLGFIAANGFNLTGETYGLLQHNSTANLEPVISDRSGCSFSESEQERVRRDVAYIPDQDEYGNSTLNDAYKQRVVFGTGHAYAGRIRPDSPRALRHAAYNAADHAAARIRADQQLNIVTYVIGLGGTGGTEPPDDELMLRLSNDIGSPIYDSSRPTGLYVYAPNAQQLSNAFLRVASEILRLAL
ncbi:MAG: VWA domain-containing protein [Bryobacter sp.]|nr:VWA domain-containing protein [Bryobacter sp.]